MNLSIAEKKRELLQGIEEESYLSASQKEELTTLVRGTEKLLVLSMVEDLLERLLIARAENYLLITRKIRQTLRMEQRRSSKNLEEEQNTADTAAMKELLDRIPS